MPNILGIEISQEHADKITETCNQILHPEQTEDGRRKIAEQFRNDFYRVRGMNPHADKNITVKEYIGKYLLENSWMIKYF